MGPRESPYDRPTSHRPGAPEVKSAVRTVTVLEPLAGRGGRPARLRELSGALGVPRSSMYALLQTLVEYGWVRTAATGYLYSVGIRALLIRRPRHHPRTRTARRPRAGDSGAGTGDRPVRASRAAPRARVRDALAPVLVAVGRPLRHTAPRVFNCPAARGRQPGPVRPARS
ncbi:helix-turn-helix domain-containing protein [Streptomyces canus]